MSVGDLIMEPMMIECPRHEGNFDCTPFCNVCEGEQEYQYTETLPCRDCQIPVDTDIWFEELEMCVDCSNKFYTHEDEEEE
jgi:hypothetical protein